jgi:hypothetical protein
MGTGQAGLRRHRRTGGRAAGLRGEPIGGGGPVRHGRDVQWRRFGAARGGVCRGQAGGHRHQVPARLAVNGSSTSRCARPEPGSTPAQHHRSVSAPLSFTSHLDPLLDGVHGRRGRSGQGQGNRGEQLLRRTTPHRPRGAGRAGDSPSLQPGRVLPVASSTGGEWGAGCVQGDGLLRRWPCGGSSNRRTSCQSRVRRAGGKRPAMPKRCPSCWLLPRSRRSIKRQRPGRGERYHDGSRNRMA